MNPLQEAIALMSKEEVRAFKLFIRKVNMQAGRKDLELFDFIRKSAKDYDEEQAYEKLYSGTSKNTFHRLKSRLLHDINRSMVDLNLANNDILRLWHFLSVVEYYQQQDHYLLSYWFLRKAENLAEKLGHLEVLDIVFGIYIRLSHEIMEINPEHYIEKRRKNSESMAKVRELDDLLAMAAYRTKIAQTYGGGGSDLINMLEKTVGEFANSQTQELSAQTRMKLFHSVSNILLDRRDYEMLEVIVQENLQRFEEDGLFNRNTHETKLRMLTYLVNALHKNQKFEASLKAAELLGREMKEYDGSFQDRYLFFYYNSLMINYFRLDIQKAVDLLHEMQTIQKIMESPFHALFVDMNLALAYNQMGQFKKAIKWIVQAQIQSAFKSAAEGLRLRISVAEIMIRLKLEQFEVLEKRFQQLNHDFSQILSLPDFKREAQFLPILERLNNNSFNLKDKQVQSEIKKFLKMPATEQDLDAELIAYAPFLNDYLKY